MLYPQNGDRFVAIDSVTSLHLVCAKCLFERCIDLNSVPNLRGSRIKIQEAAWYKINWGSAHPLEVVVPAPMTNPKSQQALQRGCKSSV